MVQYILQGKYVRMFFLQKCGIVRHFRSLQTNAPLRFDQTRDDVDLGYYDRRLISGDGPLSREPISYEF